MRITRLRLENFRIHRDSVLAIGDASFVCVKGRNFAGKTTIGQGLSMCLTPSTAGLDPQGRKFIKKIKRGESKAAITADVQTRNRLIRRTVTLNASATGRTQKSICLSDPEWNPTPFDKKLEENEAALSVVLNTDAFLRMDERRQKSLLAGLALPSRYDFDRSIVEGVEKLLPGAINFEGEPFAVITQAYKELFEERKIVNRQVREFSIPEPVSVPAGVDSASLQDQLTRLHMARREREQERTRAVADAAKEEANRTHAKSKREESLNREKREEEAIRAKMLSDGKLAYLQKLTGGKDELERLRKEHSKLLPMRESYRAQLVSLKALPKGTVTCPTCEQAVKAENLRALAEKLERFIGEINEQLSLMERKIQALGDVGVAVELLAAHEKAKADLAVFEGQAEERRRTREEVLVPEPVLFDFAPYEQSLAEIDGEVEQVTLQLRPMIAAEERRKEIAIKSAQLEKLKENAALLDTLVKYFDKDGIKAKLIGEYIGGFEAKLNEVLSAWGYSCALSIEPYSFDVTNARGDTNPVEELSGAERVMFSMAFQCAVSRTANIGLVVMDEVAMFLPELRPLLNRRLYEVLRDGYLEQVILLVADTSEQVPALPGAAFFMVDEGSVYPLGTGTTQATRLENVNA
jgi:DNA repair exonuclease SbcCD ATPase subunit